MRTSVLVLALAASSSAFFATGPTARAGRRVQAAAVSMRQPIMAGNWKMNPCSVDDAVPLAKAVLDSAQNAPCEVVIIPPYPYMGPVKDVLGDQSKVQLAAQSIFFEDSGAYTGAVSASMVKSLGAHYVLAGHSERRSIFKDDDSSINRKVCKILDAGMSVILCIGESFDEYQAGLADIVCTIELSKDLEGVTVEQVLAGRVVVAYEPVWAIGTGLTCSPLIAQKVHSGIRGWFEKNYGAAAAAEVRIQYGGSVTPDTVDDLMRQPDIDGCLVGGASLDAAKFERIVNFKV